MDGGFAAGVGGGLAVGVAVYAKDLFSKRFQQAEAGLKRLRMTSEAEAKKIERSLSVGKKLTQWGMGITAAGFMIDRALQGSVEIAEEFSQKIANVSTLLESKGVTATEEFQEALKKNIYLASKVAGKSIMEIGDASYALVSGVADANEALAAVPEAAKLARAAMGSTDSAVEILTNTLNTFAASWDMSGEEKAARISDMYSRTVALAKTNLDKMTGSMRYAGAAGMQYGQTLETVLAAMGMLQSAGIEASQAGTSFRQMFAQLSKNRDAFKRIGVDVVDAQGNYRDLVDIFGDLRKATSEMTEAELGAFLEENIGIRGSQAAVMLLNNYDEFKKMLDSIGDSAGSTGQMLEEAMKGGQAQAEALRAETEKLKAQMAEKLMPVQLKIKKGFLEIGSAVLDTPIVGEVAKWGVAIMGVGAKISKILGPTMTMVGMFKQMQAMKQINMQLTGTVAPESGRLMAGAFGTALKAAGIAAVTISAATILNAIIEKAQEKKREEIVGELKRGEEVKARTFAGEAGAQMARGAGWFAVPLVGPIIKAGKDIFRLAQYSKEEQKMAYEIAHKAAETGLIRKGQIASVANALMEKIHEEAKVRDDAISKAKQEATLTEERLRLEAQANEAFQTFINSLYEGAGITPSVAGSKQVGGFVPYTGAYMLHGGEYVVPRAQAKAAGPTTRSFVINLTFNGPKEGNEEKIAQMVERKLHDWARQAGL